MTILRQQVPAKKGDPISVPEGVVFGILSSSSIPSGWSEWTEANNYFLVGTNSDSNVGTSATGEASFVTRGVSVSGGHSGNVEADVLIKGYGGSTASGYFERSPSIDGASDVGGHSHTINESSVVNPPSKNIKLMQAGASAETNSSMIGFSTEYLPKHTQLHTWDDDNGRHLLKASTEEGTSVESCSIGMTSYDDTHDHEITTLGNAVFTTADGDSISSGGSDHTHEVTSFSVDTNSMYKIVMRAFQVLYLSDIKGLIGIWPNSGVPSGWETVATADSRYVNITSDGDGTTSGDGTVDVSGATDSVSHSHEVTGGSFSGVHSSFMAHQGEVTHSHTFSETGIPNEADRYYVKFIRKL